MSELASKNSEKKGLFSKKNGNGKKGKKKWIIIAVVLAVLIGGGYMLSKKFAGAAGEIVSVEEVKRGLLEEKIGINGTISGTDSAEISSNLPYEILQINVKEGDIVKKGDVLAVLDDRVLRDDLDMAVSDLELSRMQIQEQRNTKIDTSTEGAQIQVKQAQEDQKEAERQLAIKKSLLDSGAIPQEEYMQAELMVKKSKAAVETAEENLRRTQSEIKKAVEAAQVKGSQLKALEIKEQIISRKKSDLEKIQITTPIDGTVTRVNAKLGRLATAVGEGNSMTSRALFVVENLSDLRISVKVSEYDIGKVKIGQKVRITSDVLGDDEAEAVVARIAPTGELKEGSANREMVIPVELHITKRDPRLIAGITAQATIEIEKKDNVLKVPVDALYEKEGENYIVLFHEDASVKNGGIVKVLKVKTGLESATEAEVSSAELKEGDRVILSPRVDFADGDKVVLESLMMPDPGRDTGGEKQEEKKEEEKEEKKDE